MEAVKRNDRPRDRSDMEYEVNYSIRLLTLHCNFSRNADLLLNAATLLGLTSAVGSFVDTNSVFATIAGALLAIVAVTQILLKPSEKKVEAKFRKQLYSDLKVKWGKYTDMELDSELSKLHGSDSNEIEGLRLVAEYDVRNEMGIITSDLPPLNWWNKFLRFCS